MPDNKLDILVLLRETSDPRPPARVITRGAAISERGLRRYRTRPISRHWKRRSASRTVSAPGDGGCRRSCPPRRHPQARLLHGGRPRDPFPRPWPGRGDAVADARVLGPDHGHSRADPGVHRQPLADRGDDPVPALAAAAADMPCIAAAVSFAVTAGGGRGAAQGGPGRTADSDGAVSLHGSVRGNAASPAIPSMDAVTAGAGMPSKSGSWRTWDFPSGRSAPAGAYLAAGGVRCPAPRPGPGRDPGPAAACVRADTVASLRRHQGPGGETASSLGG